MLCSLAIAAGSLSACAEWPRTVSLQVVHNYPFENPRLTDGDYTASGAYNAHITDAEGACVAHDRTAFRSVLSGQADDQAVQVAVTVFNLKEAGTYHHQSSTAPAQTYATVILHTGDPSGLNGQVGAQDQSQHFYGGVADGTSVSVTVNPDRQSGRVVADLKEEKPESREVTVQGRKLTRVSFAPVPGAGLVHLTGTFKCVAPPP